MKRIFQHYEGEIDVLKGMKFSCVKTVTELSTKDDLLVWLKDANSKHWYRVFIDGAYCGIDQYTEDLSEEDMDEGFTIDDHSSWFLDKVLTSAWVESVNKPDLHSVLHLNFDSQECQFRCKNEDGDCELVFGDQL